MIEFEGIPDAQITNNDAPNRGWGVCSCGESVRQITNFPLW